MDALRNLLWFLAGFAAIAMMGIGSAHAQSCPPGQNPVITVQSIQPGIGGFQPTCSAGSQHPSREAALNACMPPDGTVSADGGIKIIGRALSAGGNPAYYYGANPGGSYVGESGGSFAEGCSQAQCTAHPVGQSFYAGSVVDGLSPTICDQNCTADLVGGNNILTVGTGWQGIYRSTGQYCGASQSLVIDVVLDQPKCQTVPGKQVCIGGGIPGNCIDVDGSRSCYSDAGGVCTTPECTATAPSVMAQNGSVVTAQGSTASPTPHTTADGQAASPTNPSTPKPADATYGIARPNGSGSTTTNTYNYYAPATVSGSCRGACADGETPGQGGGDGDGEGEGDEPVSDTPFPAAHVPYEKRYPDGVSGVWQSKMGELQQTALIGGVAAMFPTLPGGGSCPSWTMPLNFGPAANFGAVTLAAPCWLWDVVGYFFLITACLVARALIFGG